MYVKDMTLFQLRQHEAALVKEMRYASPADFEIIGFDLQEVRDRIAYLTGQV